MDYAEQDGTPEVPATVGWGSIGAANQALIMDHYRNPRNRAPVDAPDIEATEVNPFCGDECTFRARLTDGVLSTVGTEGAGAPSARRRSPSCRRPCGGWRRRRRCTSRRSSGA